MDARSTRDRAPGLALVIGAGGGLGAALADGLSGAYPAVLRLGRTTAPTIDYMDETSLKTAATWVAEQCAAQQR
jgi:NAD(P)-dependent dehydrogenase (short-subunit alcohol dehydrogenase family)